MTTAALFDSWRDTSRAEHRHFPHCDPALVYWALFQIACQVALLFGAVNPVRTWVRAASFIASIVFLVLVTGTRRRYPAAAVGILICLIAVVEIAHPTTNTLISGIASAAFYLAILGPMFWAARMRLDVRGMGTLLLIIWTFHALSAATGVLQVFFPGRLQPNISPVVLSMGHGYISQLYITTPSGAQVLRPMGLTDAPGGASVSGFYAAVIGLALLLNTYKKRLKPAFLVGIGAAFACLFLAQVRSLLIITVISVIVMLVGLVRVPKIGRKAGWLVLGALVLWGGYQLAIGIGGRATVSTRLGSLVAASPTAVYGSTRGQFLNQTVNELLPRYPFGAGLGRWGMMRSYFGTDNGVERGSIYSEIQWTGWLLDGGVPLVLAYSAALIIAVLTAMRIGANARIQGNTELQIWALMIVAYDVGMISLTFNSSPFASQLGMEFWLLNACLFAAASTGQRVPTSRYAE